MTTQREGDVQVELFVRSELPPPAGERATSIEEQLEALEARGVVDGVERRSWAKRVPVDRCETDHRDVYLSFTAWARDEGVSLQPFFQTRERYSRGQDRLVDWLVMPAICLAVYEGDTLEAVYPHADGGETWTVEDGIHSALGDGPEAAEPSSSALAD